MSHSSSSSSSFAEIVRTVKTVRTVRVEKFSPVKASHRRVLISSTPAFKRKRCQIESFSPVPSPDHVQEAKDTVIAAQNLRFTIRRRKNDSVNKCRRLISSKPVSNFSSTSTQTDEEDNLLIDKYIEEVARLRAAQSQTAISLQLEKEKSSALRKTVLNVLERAEIAVDDCESQNIVLNETVAATQNPDLSSPAGLKVYHDEISRAVRIKSRIYNGLLSTLKSIKKECYSNITDLKRRSKLADKNSSVSRVNNSSSKKVTVYSNKLSDMSILTKKVTSSQLVPLNPNVTFLRAPNNKSVKFRVPLEEFLAQGQTESTNLLINVSHEKIEIEIPRTVSPNKVQISQGGAIKYKIPEDLNLSQLNISQNSTSFDELHNEWDRFAYPKHAISDDDAGSLLNYDSSPTADEIKIKKEATESDVSPNSD